MRARCDASKMRVLFHSSAVYVYTKGIYTTARSDDNKERDSANNANLEEEGGDDAEEVVESVALTGGPVVFEGL